jgi:hypothetical protein
MRRIREVGAVDPAAVRNDDRRDVAKGAGKRRLFGVETGSRD